MLRNCANNICIRTITNRYQDGSVGVATHKLVHTGTWLVKVEVACASYRSAACAFQYNIPRVALLESYNSNVLMGVAL